MTQVGRRSRFSSWLVFGVSFAVSAVDAWIWLVQEPDWLGFRLLLGAPLYFAASFGLTWPLLTAVQVFVARFRGATPFPWVRVLIAALVFRLGWYLAVPLARDTYENSEVAAKHRQDDLERTEDQLAHNILLFREPVSRSEENALVHFIQERPIDPESSIEAARHYSHTPAVLWALAGRAAASPDCLRTLYEEWLESSGIVDNVGYLRELPLRVGNHPNTPVDVLQQMIRSGQGGAAFRNQRLPKVDKIAFLKRAAASDSSATRSLVAADPDTPTPILRKLSSDPAPVVVEGLLGNPSTPDDVLEKFTHLEVFRRSAEAQIARRTQSKPDATRK
jgi:hypothetical protein